MLRITATAVALAALLGASMAGSAVAKPLTVGANIGNVPWEFQNKQGQYVGFEVDLVKKIADRLDDDVNIQNIPFNGLFSAVESGRIDVAISSITITDKRLKSVSFTQPYYDSDQSLATRTDSGVKSTKDLKDKTIGVDTGSTGDIYATKRKNKWGLAAIRRYEGLNPAMLDLASGRIDGYVSDIPAVTYYLKNKPTMTVVERLKTGEHYSMMFAKNSPLAKKANDAITALKKNGYLPKLYKKWFGVKPEKSTSTVQVIAMPKPKS